MKNPLIQLKKELEQELVQLLLNAGYSFVEKINLTYNSLYNCFTSTILFKLDQKTKLNISKVIKNAKFECFFIHVKNNYINIYLNRTKLFQLTNEIIDYLSTQRKSSSTATFNVYYNNFNQLNDFRYLRTKSALINIMLFYGYSINEYLIEKESSNNSISFELKSNEFNISKVIAPYLIESSVFDKYSKNFVALALLKMPPTRYFSLKNVDLSLSVKNDIYITAYILTRISKISCKRKLLQIEDIDQSFYYYFLELADILSSPTRALSISPLMNLLFDICNYLFKVNIYSNSNLIFFSSFILRFTTNIFETYFESY